MAEFSAQRGDAVPLGNDQQVTPLSRQITKQNVTKLNTDIPESQDSCLSSPEGGTQSEISSQLGGLPMRESSSAFLASLTSASDISSPMTSAFPSTDSLQNADDKDAGSMPGSAQSGSMIEMALVNRKPAKKSVSSDETTTLSHDTLPPDDSTPPVSHQLESSQEWYHKTPTNHERHHDMSAKPPSRTHTPSQSNMSTPGDHSRPDHIPGHVYYSSGAHDEEYEQSHSKTPLMHAEDYPEPKETKKAIKSFDEDGNKLINQYETIQKLGAGAHGAVKLGKDTTSGQYVAIKIVKRYPKKPRLGKNENPEDKVKKEVAVLKKARHPHVVSLLEVIDDPELKKVYLVLEYVERGEIKWRKRTDREIAKFEMNRMRREIAGNLDEAAETEHLMMFNESLLQRHYERHARSATSSSAPESYNEDYNYQEHDEHRPFQMSSHRSSPFASRPTSRPPSELDLSTANHTLRVPSRASSRGDFYTANDVAASVYSSHFEEVASVPDPDIFERDRWLNDEPSMDQQWTPEEEEYRFVPCLTLSEARDIFRDTVLGLEYLHYHGIIHRDIKPANLLWTRDYRVKISDFGVSYLGRPLRGEGDEAPVETAEDVSIELAKTVGTPAFYAPELCDPDLFDAEKTVTRPHITGKIDVWALGITLYAMVYGRLPFFEQNEFAMYEKIARAELQVPSKRLRGINFDEHDPRNTNKREEHVLMYEDVSEDLQDLLRKLLVKDPTKRATIIEVKHHAWVVRGVEDRDKWLKVTDPAQAGKIELSQVDLKEAVVPRTFLGKVWTGLANMTRGRVPSRRRAETSSKNQAKLAESSSSRSIASDKEARGSSLKGNELVDTLRSTRPIADHPLSKSTVVTPLVRDQDQYFAPIHQVDSQGNVLRPTIKTATTADSVLTIRGPPRQDESFHYDHPPQSAGDSGGSSSSLAKIFDNTKEVTRRFTSRVRGRDSQSIKSDELDAASRASSGDNIALQEAGRSLKPSLAVSPAVAAGHVEPPASLHPDSALSSPIQSTIAAAGPLGKSSAESLQSYDRGRTARKRASTVSSASWGPISPTVEDMYRARLTGATANLPSPTTSAPANRFLPLTNNAQWTQSRQSEHGLQAIPAYAATSSADAASLLTTGETITPAIMKQKAAERAGREKQREDYKMWREKQRLALLERRSAVPVPPTQQEDDHEDDEGNDDEGIVMHDRKQKD